MKKISYILLSVFVFSLVIFGGILMSCELTENKPESMIKAPGVKRIEDGKGLVVTVYNVSDVKYINFYRQDVTDKDNPGPVVNIGVLFPEHYSEHGWLYQDYYVYSGNKYKYCVKYTTGDGTYKSGWSDVIEAKSPYLQAADLFKYTIPEASYFEFAGGPQEWTLTLMGADISEERIPAAIFSEDKAKAKIIFSNGTLKKAYPLSSLTAGTVLRLRDFLGPEFYNTEITVDCVVFEKLIIADPDPNAEDEEDEEPKIRCVVWGEPNEGKIVIRNRGTADPIESFIVKPSTEDQVFDHSDLDIN